MTKHLKMLTILRIYFHVFSVGKVELLSVFVSSMTYILWTCACLMSLTNISLLGKTHSSKNWHCNVQRFAELKSEKTLNLYNDEESRNIYYLLLLSML